MTSAGSRAREFAAALAGLVAGVIDLVVLRQFERDAQEIERIHRHLTRAVGLVDETAGRRFVSQPTVHGRKSAGDRTWKEHGVN